MASLQSRTAGAQGAHIKRVPKYPEAVVITAGNKHYDLHGTFSKPSCLGCKLSELLLFIQSRDTRPHYSLTHTNACKHRNLDTARHLMLL